MNTEIRTTGPVLTNQSEVNRDRPFDFGTTTLPHPEEFFDPQAHSMYDKPVQHLRMSDIDTIQKIADSNMRAEKPRLPYTNQTAKLYAIFGNRSFEAAHNGTVADGAVLEYVKGIGNIMKARDTMLHNTWFWNEALKPLREELNTREVPASWMLTTEGEVKPADDNPDSDQKVGMADFLDGLFLKSGEVINNASGSAIPTTLGRNALYRVLWKKDLEAIEAATKASRYARKSPAPENAASATDTEGYGRRLAPQKLERHQVEVPAPDVPAAPATPDTADINQAPTPLRIDDNKTVQQARGAVTLSFLPPEKQQPEFAGDDLDDDEDDNEDQKSK